jgi:hypothetical protein
MLLIISLFLIGDCEELFQMPGGGSKSVGPNDKPIYDESSSPPVYNSPRTVVITRDPANYMNPAVTISKFTPSTDTSSKNNNLSGLGGGTGTFGFSMTSEVAGTGKFSARSMLEGLNGLDHKAYNSVSAKYGDLTQSRNIKFFEDSSDGSEFNYTRGNIYTQESTKFFGNSYSDISKYQNNEDLIQEIITSGAISKNSSFASQHVQVSLDGNETKTLHNNYTAYNIDTRFVGSSDLHSITNGTEIMQTYIGQIVLVRKIVSQFMSNDTLLADEWLPCCNSSSISDRFLADRPAAI